jgi:hypothetical protein
MATTLQKATAPPAPATLPQNPQNPQNAQKPPRSTPGTLRLLLIGLVVLCLGWGALAAVTVTQHATAASQVVTVSEPLSLDAQQIYQSLADADVTVVTAYLYGQQQPFSARQRFQNDIATVAADLKTATAASGNTGEVAIGASLATLTAALPVYTGYVEDSQVYGSVGIPAGGSFMQVASEEMHLVLLPAARTVYDEENARLTAASGQATGLPLVVVAVAAGLLAGLAGFRAQRWLSARTKRRINRGLFLATVAGAVALAWLAIAMAVGRADLLQATQHGSRPAETLAQADIGVLQARGDQALNLISHTGDGEFQANIHAIQASLGPQLTSASSQSTPAAARLITDAGHAATTWFGINQQLHALDAVYNYGAETRLAIGTGSGSSATAFARLQSDIGAAIAADQAVFSANATAGQDAFGGLEIGIIVLALVMAAGCAWGLYRRLAEYR